MSTDANTPHPISEDVRWSIGREIMSVLNACTINLSIEQTMQELQLAVERLTFGSESMGHEMSMDDIDSLLSADISHDTMTFLAWLHRRNVLQLMIGERGRLMLSYCARYYRSVREVRCSTPIPLRESFRITLLSQLRVAYPEPARIVFETVPSLLAGCVIDDGQKRRDMSLQGMMPNYVNEFLATKKDSSPEVVA